MVCKYQSRSHGADTKTWLKTINLTTLMSNINVKSGSWMYATDSLRVINEWAKYGKPMIKKK